MRLLYNVYPPHLKKQASNNVYNNTARSAVSVISEHSNDEYNSFKNVLGPGQAGKGSGRKGTLTDGLC